VPAFQKISKLPIKLSFEKKFSGALVYTGGAAGIWAIHFFSSAYFDEIIIFGLSKEPKLSESDPLS
jgi:hypothetical protein